MYSPLCEHCLKFFDKSTFIDAVSKTNAPGAAGMSTGKDRFEVVIDTVAERNVYAPAVIALIRELSNVEETAGECDICKIVLSNAHVFEDKSPVITIEFNFGFENYDIKLIRLMYHGPVSGDDVGFPTGYYKELRSYKVHALPSMLYLSSV